MKKEVTISQLKDIVCSYYNISHEKLLSKNQKREIVTARQIGMSLASKYTVNSLTVIGQKFGNKDHSTVIHSKKVINDLLETEPKFKNQYSEIEQLLKDEGFVYIIDNITIVIKGGKAFTVFPNVNYHLLSKELEALKQQYEEEEIESFTINIKKEK